MKVLILAAHPDDEALGCGGTINRFVREGADVRVITFTDGGSSRGDENDRRSELESSSKILGFSILEMFNFPDNALDQVPLLQINKAVESALSKNNFSPDVILTHNPWCLNIDHKIVFESAQVISRPLKCKIMCFEIPSSSEWNFISEFKANCFVTLTAEDVNNKIESLKKCYSNEMRAYPHPRSYENVMNLSKVNGSVVNSEFAERFMIVKEVM